MRSRKARRARQRVLAESLQQQGDFRRSEETLREQQRLKLEVRARLTAQRREAREKRREASPKRYALRKACRAAPVLLTNDERIVDASVRGSSLSLTTGWIHAELRRTKIAIGRFRIVIGGEKALFRIDCIESGKLNGEDPFYVYPHTAEGFCFGMSSLKGFIGELIAQGEIVAATYLILDALAHINTNSESEALNQYRIISEEEGNNAWLFSQRL